MGKYARQPSDPLRSAKSRGSYLRVSFKNTRETAMAIKGKGLLQAKTYLEQVLDHQRCIPFRRFCGGVGRTAHAKAERSTDAILGLLQNMESNAELKGLQPEALFIQHVQVNQAPKQRRRTYRAHGRM